MEDRLYTQYIYGQSLQSLSGLTEMQFLTSGRVVTYVAPPKKMLQLVHPRNSVSGAPVSVQKKKILQLEPCAYNIIGN
jgi:hypothetical protein